MSVIDKSQGAVKINEVAVDSAQPVINTAAREDGLTVLERLRRLVTDSFRRNTILLSSSAPISWAGGVLQISNGVSISLLLLAAPDSATDSFKKITYTSVGVTNWAINDGDVVYVELERSLLDAGASITLTDGITGGAGSGTVGRRIRKSPPSPIPFIDDLNDGSPQGTLMIPIAIRSDSTSAKKNLWWVPHGTLWSEDITGTLGRLSTTTTIPIGGIIPFHIPSVTNVGTGPSQAVVDFYAPGFQLCNGSTVTNAASPFYNKIVPNLNENVSYQLATVSDYNPPDLGGNRFLKGGANSSVATANNNHVSVGGKSQVVLSASTMPAHSHVVQNSNYNSTIGGKHFHDRIKVTSPTGTDIVLADDSQNNSNRWDTNNTSSSPVPLRARGWYGGLARSPHTHTVNDNTGHTGLISPNAAPHENQPPYYNAVYIIRII